LDFKEVDVFTEFSTVLFDVAALLGTVVEIEEGTSLTIVMYSTIVVVSRS
jgi:hypothetical protein